MVSYTAVFSGNTLYPSDVSYLALPLVADITLQWPLQAPNGNPDNPVLARIIDVAPTGAFSIFMPDATQASPGETVLFNNLGPNTITIRDATGATLASISQGAQWELYLIDASTEGGLWRAFRFGAATAQAQASALAGPGLIALGSQLATAAAVTLLNMDFTVSSANRATTFVWTGALGTLTLPAAGTAGNNFFFEARNGGTGNFVIAAVGGDLINGASTLVMLPGDSAIFETDGTSWYTVGLGQNPVFAFDYTTIDLTGQVSPYTLSGSELNRIAYLFEGVLTGNFEVIIPATTQQYWLGNGTTGGSFTLRVGTLAQSPRLQVNRGARGIYYCDGANLVNADTQAISFPVAVVDGGTGATTAPNALINLGGGSVGIAIFESPDQATAQAALGVSSGNEDEAILWSVVLG